VAAALVALRDEGVDAGGGHLLGVAARPDGDHGDDAGVLAALDQIAAGRAGEAADAHATVDERVRRRSAIGLIGAQVDAEGAIGAAASPRRWPRRAGAASWWRRRRHAERARGAGGGAEARPGDPAHARLDDGMLDAEQLAGARSSR
jgi:hypothetical protein